MASKKTIKALALTNFYLLKAIRSLDKIDTNDWCDTRYMVARQYKLINILEENAQTLQAFTGISKNYKYQQ